MRSAVDGAWALARSTRRASPTNARATSSATTRPPHAAAHVSRARDRTTPASRNTSTGGTLTAPAVAPEEGGRGDGGGPGRQADTLQALPGDPVPQPAPAAALEHGPQPAGHGDQPGAQQQAAREQPGDPGLGGDDEAQQHDPQEEPLDRPQPGGLEALLAVRPGPPHPRVDDQGGGHADQDGRQRAGHGTDEQRDVRRREGRASSARATTRRPARATPCGHGGCGPRDCSTFLRTPRPAGADRDWRCDQDERARRPPAVPERSAVYRRGRPLRAGERRRARAVSRPGRGPGRRGPRCRAAPRRRWRS